jgi:hypothetical protein
MAKKVVRVSDLSGDVIPEGSGATVRVVFSDARRGVRELDVTDAEAEAREASGEASRPPPEGNRCVAPQQRSFPRLGSPAHVRPPPDAGRITPEKLGG